MEARGKDQFCVRALQKHLGMLWQRVLDFHLLQRDRERPSVLSKDAPAKLDKPLSQRCRKR